MKKILITSFILVAFVFAVTIVVAQSPTPNGRVQSATTDVLEETLVVPLRREPGELEALLASQDPGPVLVNPIKHAVRAAVSYGVSVDTLTMLLLLPLVATVIAGARHLVGLQGFGILLPAALSVVFVSTGPILGLGLFLVIVSVATLVRMILRNLKLNLQYLPRMAFILWTVVVGVLLTFLITSLVTDRPQISDISIFPVLILVLLAEDFTRVQLGKSIRVAITLTTETLILALISFIILQLRVVQNFSILNPEILLILVAILDFFLGRYAGLRLLELWRFRKLTRS